MNRHTIQVKERIAGSFSLISNTILYNKDLQAFDKILLISILSDSDSYTFNITTYANRFKCSDDKISRSIGRLKKAGFIKQEKLKERFNTWNYTISEYGNLNTTKAETIEEPIPTEQQSVEHEIIQHDEQIEHINEAVNDSPTKEESDLKMVSLGEYSDLIFSVFDNAIANGWNVNQDEYIEYIKDSVANGKLKSSKQITYENLELILKSLVIKLTDKDVDIMVDKKSDNLSIKDTASLKLIMKEWLKENPDANERLLSQETLKKKNKYRKPIAGYND